MRTKSFIVLLSLLIVSCSQKPAVDPSGFYLAEGGRTYLEIHRGQSGDFVVTPSAPGQMITLKIEPGQFTLNESQPFGQAEMVGTKRFKPSATIPGDWDLVEHVITFVQGNNEEKSTLTRPLPSYLHHADRSALQYYMLFDNMVAPGPVDPEQLKSDNNQLLEIAQSVVDKSPDDIFLRVLLLDALQRTRDAARLEPELARDEPLFEKSGNVSLVRASRLAARNLGIIKAELKGRNAWQNLHASNDLNTQWKLTQSLPDDAIVMNPDIYFIDRLSAANAVPNLLGVQTFFRVMRVESVYAMLLGRPRDALLAMTSLIRMGHEMIKDGTLINRLIGFATTQIATEGMKFYVLNVSDSARDVDEAWAALEKLDASYAPGAGDLFSLESPMSALYQGANELNRQEAVTRLKTTDAHFALLRMATAARGRFLATGSFPSGNDQFAPYLTTPPIDPFTSATLLMVSTTDKFTAYSTGPDRDDDRAQVTYDPTNGTISDGDIVCEVPRVRQYPIPAGGLRASTVDDISRQMPGGLPADVFATTKGHPLNIGQTRPLTIFSWGPDMDERVQLQSRTPRAVPEIQYDPTNGTNSNGDLVMTVNQ